MFQFRQNLKFTGLKFDIHPFLSPLSINMLNVSEKKGASVWWMFHRPKGQDAQGLFVALSVARVTLCRAIWMPQ